MSVFTAILIGLATGAVFGFVLEKSRVFEPGIIVGQMQLRSHVMVKVFLAAVVTGLVTIAVMHGVFGVKLHLKPLVLGADIVGGLILGAGIALAGACPGTSLAQIGAGYKDAWFTVLGGIAGAITYGYFESSIVGLLPTKGATVSFDQLLGLPFWVAALVFAAAMVAMLVGLERHRSWRSEVGENVDGVTATAASGSAADGKRGAHGAA